MRASDLQLQIFIWWHNLYQVPGFTDISRVDDGFVSPRNAPSLASAWQ